ncbi:hypothetical protein KY325_04015 [Candidatus Woesearchaeota archaeon]|nr:hypothetical protein [Candidatus Woesearchaeota archaeon]MBW3018300.1 hypothetical protein [Candidatus Woesearchaeota archaeon]
MAKKKTTASTCGCMKCGCGKSMVALCGIIVLILGIIFLLVDLGKWDFWGIHWWTVAFILVGLAKLCWSMKN